ncbi:hypothetical protein [Nocardia sp. NPDC056000]|uniref:hypothetical protein n=1 Tax=Nocardia sp. NPDC056000 TaxID=3345674 RepID=UPI0035E3321C
MPRKRPDEIRARAAPRRRSHSAEPIIEGLSSSALAEIDRLERTRNYLHAGDVAKSVRLWKTHVRRPARELWLYYEYGDVHDFCCGSPVEARHLLNFVIAALSPRAARELRMIIGRLDAQID